MYFMQGVTTMLNEKCYFYRNCKIFYHTLPICIGITAPTTAGSAMVQQQSLKITEILVQRVEVVYVLGLFLLGKHRKKVRI